MPPANESKTGDEGESQALVEMPKYKCIKEVHALKIKDISLGHTYNSGLEYAVLTPVEAGFGLIEVPKAYIEKHKPEVGGYYVVYKDGYKSFSPEKAFEEGYIKIS